MTFFHSLVLVLGLSALIGGAELLVKKAELLAKGFRVNTFFMGIILLGMGTSAPEWAVSALSSVRGLSDLAVANVFGSNIFNILLVLALALFHTLAKEKIKIIKKDILFLVLSSLALIPIMWDHFLSRYDAFFLSLIFLLYITFSMFFARKGTEHSVDLKLKPKKLIKEIFFIVLSFILLIGGSHLTVTGATGLGQTIGMSERLIGILIVSAGTSLPELFTSFVAIRKNQKDMAIGNIIGSNIFNTFAIFSTAAWILPAKLDPKMLYLDLPALLIIHIFLLLIIFCYKLWWIQKSLPYIFLSGYILYLIFLFKF